MDKKKNLIEEILKEELNMFLNVRSRYPVSCQENPEAFRLHRGAQFSVWSDETLESYLKDLLSAKKQGQNMMTLKYARMENLIPPVSLNPVIDKIVDMEVEAQKEMLSRYPNICGRGRPLEEDSPEQTSFKTYLRGELETYSDRTLELLCKDIQQITDRGENWEEHIYSEVVRKLGYHSLDQAEEILRKKGARIV